VYSPRFSITPYLLSLLSEIAVLRFQIDHFKIDLVWETQLQSDTINRLAHASTSIEGNPLRLDEVGAISRNEPVSASLIARLEVKNYLSAIREIWAKAPGATITESDLFALHRTLMEGVLPTEKIGRYKTLANRIVNFKGEPVYFPPGPAQTPTLTQEFLEWLNSKDALQLDPVMVSAIAHHRLVSIHPFLDGNGRISRALGMWILHNRRADNRHITALDEYFEKDRDLYYLKLQQARDLDDDLTYWLEYVADGMRQTLTAVKLRLELVQVIPQSGYKLSAKQESVIRFLRDRSPASSSDLEGAFNISRARVNQIIKPLVAQGIVHRTGNSRATRYSLPQIERPQ